jgi:hypothetical protein
MQIGGISSFSSIAPAFHPILAAKPASNAVSALPSTSASGASSTIQTAAPTQTTSAPASRPYDRGRDDATVSAAGAAAAAASSSTAEQLVGIYSTTVGGQQYAGTMEQSNGVYTISTLNPPVATATGINEMVAEEKLNTIIEEMI